MKIIIKIFVLNIALVFYLAGCGGSSSGNSEKNIMKQPNDDSAEKYNVTIKWQPSSGNVAGYNIRYGNQPGQYDQSLTVNGGDTNETMIPQLLKGDYYFILTAFSDNGAEGKRSDTFNVYVGG